MVNVNSGMEWIYKSLIGWSTSIKNYNCSEGTSKRRYQALLSNCCGDLPAFTSEISELALLLPVANEGSMATLAELVVC